MRNFLEIKGSHYEIGYHLGKYWGDYFQKLEKNKGQGRQKKKLVEKYLHEWISRESRYWNREYEPLLENTMKHFPEIIYEIEGMEKGVTESGLSTSLMNMFELCLAETGDKECHCSSMVAKTKRGFVLGTNDEYTSVYPLLFAKVSLENGESSKRFASISHPFQLLGSAAGMNKHIAFQGNSIGFSNEVYQNLKKTWDCRIPKTVLSRKMLEMDDIDEVKSLLESYHTTLPNHHYIVSHDRAVSVDVVPKLDDIDRFKGNAIKIIEIKDRHLHTNHFLKGNRSRQKPYLKDDIWEWACEEDRDDSKIRYEKLLKETQITKNQLDYKSIKEILQGMAHEDKKHTSASIFFEMNKCTAHCESFFYFDKNIHIEKELS